MVRVAPELIDAAAGLLDRMPAFQGRDKLPAARAK